MTKQPLQPEWIDRIFMRLHGRFGNTFFNKFKLGAMNANGEDAGIANAKATWAYELSGISPERIKAALEAHYDHAPSCDDFKSNCYIRQAVQDYKALPAPADLEANRKNAEKVHNFVAEHMKPKNDYRAWIKPILENPSKYPEISVKYAKEVEALQGGSA